MDTWLKKKKKKISTKKLGTEYNPNKESTSEHKKMAVHAALITIARTWMHPRIDVH